jgi:hypothetical protein
MLIVGLLRARKLLVYILNPTFPDNDKRKNEERKNHMFTAILRRWRLLTPLALAVLAVAIVTSGVLASASAHSVQFHFWGRATVLEDNSIVLPDWACDTGPQQSLDGTQINFSNNPCIPVFGGVGTTATNGQNEVGSDLTGNPSSPGFVASLQLGQASVKTDSNKKEGHTISQATAYGLSIGQCFPASATDDCDGDDNDSTPIVLLTAVELQVTAEAECKLAHGRVHASARATTFEVFNDLFVLEGFHTTPGGSPILAHLTPSGNTNESYPIFNVVTLHGTFAEQLTVNEQSRFHDGSIAWIKTTGVHLIMTNASGTVILNLSIDSVFAAIHCGKHLPQDDAIGA